jgi:hypothetical protein
VALSDKELDISFSQGVIDALLEMSIPQATKDALKEVNDAVNYYRDKYTTLQEDYTTLQTNYNNLTSLSANYLAMIQQQKSQIDALLIETQRDLHKPELE